MDKREQIKRWFSFLNAEHKNNAEIILSQKYHVTTNTVRMMWVYHGKFNESYIDDILKVIKKEFEKQEAKRQKEIQQLIDAI